MLMVGGGALMLNYPHLFSPIKVGNVVFRNRIFASPTGWVDIKDDCTLGDNAIDYYAEKAKGGAASVCVGECQVDHPRGSRGGLSRGGTAFPTSPASASLSCNSPPPPPRHRVQP